MDFITGGGRSGLSILRRCRRRGACATRARRLIGGCLRGRIENTHTQPLPLLQNRKHNLFRYYSASYAPLPISPVKKLRERRRGLGQEQGHTQRLWAQVSSGDRGHHLVSGTGQS